MLWHKSGTYLLIVYCCQPGGKVKDYRCEQSGQDGRRGFKYNLMEQLVDGCLSSRAVARDLDIPVNCLWFNRCGRSVKGANSLLRGGGAEEICDRNSWAIVAEAPLC